ncbi:hypothetical protein MTO96_025867 [Rhipicephalus appendiculatus]
MDCRLPRLSPQHQALLMRIGLVLLALVVETLDRRSSPCDDLHAYVCSGWMREHSFTSTHDKQMELLTWHARSGLQRIASRRANVTTSSITSGNR